MMKLEKVIIFIPLCTENNDKDQFINACYLTVESIDPVKLPELFNFIIIK